MTAAGDIPDVRDCDVPDGTDGWEGIGRLSAHHSEVPPAVQLLKLSEEVGEAASAYIGLTGMNSRKGVYATREDLLGELGDVIITAAVAMTGITGDAAAAGEHFRAHLAAVLDRAGLTRPVDPE
jgi:NTP pyrophosphatase (non-canonical NTP hydrolase)